MVRSAVRSAPIGLYTTSLLGVVQLPRVHTMSPLPSVTQSHNFTSYVQFTNFVHLVPMNAQSWVPGSILTFAPNRCTLKLLWRTAFH